MFADFRVRGLNTTFFQCFHFRSTPICRKKTKEGLPPDFLWSLVALAKLMRLSLLKAAHAVVSGAAYRKSGSPVLFGPRTLRRTWGTRPVPNGSARKLTPAILVGPAGSWSCDVLFQQDKVQIIPERS